MEESINVPSDMRGQILWLICLCEVKDMGKEELIEKVKILRAKLQLAVSEYDDVELKEATAIQIEYTEKIGQHECQQRNISSVCRSRLEDNMFTMPTIDMVATGKNIVRLREATGMTVKDIQDIFGIATPQTIYKWQHGTALPSIDNLVVLVAIFDVTVDQILVVDTDGIWKTSVGFTTSYLSFSSSYLCQYFV